MTTVITNKFEALQTLNQPPSGHGTKNKTNYESMATNFTPVVKQELNEAGPQLKWIIRKSPN